MKTASVYTGKVYVILILANAPRPLRMIQYYLLLTTTTVTSSAGSAPLVNAASAPQIAPIASSAVASTLAATAWLSRPSPNSSPSLFSASVTPSV